MTKDSELHDKKAFPEFNRLFPRHFFISNYKIKVISATIINEAMSKKESAYREEKYSEIFYCYYHKECV
jgi:hypothetical protein